MNVTLRTAGLGAIAALFVMGAGTTAISIWAKGAATERAAAVAKIEERTREAIIPLVTVVKDLQIDVVQVQQFLTDTSATRGLDGLDDGIGEAAKFAEKFRKHAAEARRLAAGIDDSELVGSLDRTAAAFPAFYEMGQKMTQAYVAQGPAGGNKLMSGFDKVADELTTELESVVKRRDALVEQSAERSKAELAALDATLARASNATIFANILSFLFLSGAAVGLLKLIIGPILEMAAFLEKLASGALDIETHQVEHQNEIGRMARAAVVFRENALQRDKLETAARNERQYEFERQKRLEQQVANFRKDVGEIVMSVGYEADRMGGTAQALNDVANRADRTAGSARTAASDASVNIHTVSVAAEELAASVTEISHQIRNASQSANRATEIARQTDANISSLVALSDRVGAIVEMIRTIAQQTNLLALNATIEAARAGEAGRGFAVVASEVKTLAGHTARATDDVAAQIAAIQNATHQAVGDIRAITAAVAEIDALTEAVAASVAQQNEATNEIASAISRASASSSTASGDVDQVASVIGETSTEAGLVTEATELLSASARRLTTTVEGFLRDVTQDVKDRRVGTRRRTTQAIVVMANGRRIPTKLADISDTGAKIFASEDLRSSERFHVQFEDGSTVGAQMVWNKGGFAGIHFDAPLDAVDEKSVA